MKIVIIGCGNVGSNLLHHLGEVLSIARISIIDIDPMIAEAAILDLAGYQPEFAHRVYLGSVEELQEADIIVHSAGQKSIPGTGTNQIADQNKSIIDRILEKHAFKPEAIVISLPAPVETLTAYLNRSFREDNRKVLGFGGDLDLNRLRYLLQNEDLITTDIHFIGEHGENGIPVYPGEESYIQIRDNLRCFLSKIGSLAGTKRNLATAPLLATLIKSIAFNQSSVHYVAGYHPEYKVHLTWPFVIDGSGIVKPIDVELPERARQDLDRLVCYRRKEEECLF